MRDDDPAAQPDAADAAEAAGKVQLKEEPSVAELSAPRATRQGTKRGAPTATGTTDSSTPRGGTDTRQSQPVLQEVASDAAVAPVVPGVEGEAEPAVHIMGAPGGADSAGKPGGDDSAAKPAGADSAGKPAVCERRVSDSSPFINPIAGAVDELAVSQKSAGATAAAAAAAADAPVLPPEVTQNQPPVPPVATTRAGARSGASKAPPAGVYTPSSIFMTRLQRVSIALTCGCSSLCEQHSPQLCCSLRLVKTDAPRSCSNIEFNRAPSASPSFCCLSACRFPFVCVSGSATGLAVKHVSPQTSSSARTLVLVTVPCMMYYVPAMLTVTNSHI